LIERHVPEVAAHDCDQSRSVAFTAPPSKSIVPDYFDIVDRSEFVTWGQLKSKKLVSRAALYDVVSQLATNARVYNRGCEVPNKAYTGPGCGKPPRVRRGPGRVAHAGVAVLADVFGGRVREFLEQPAKAHRVRPAWIVSAKRQSRFSKRTALVRLAAGEVALTPQIAVQCMCIAQCASVCGQSTTAAMRKRAVRPALLLGYNAEASW
jgi:hypothetical protein